MGVGKQFRDQQSRYEDPISGREVTCLTNWPGHSWQFYFTHPRWFDGGRAFLFHSERDNASNYFHYELATGEIVQLTACRAKRPSSRVVCVRRPVASTTGQGCTA